jgi:hypothetical protein
VISDCKTEVWEAYRQVKSTSEFMRICGATSEESSVQAAVGKAHLSATGPGAVSDRQFRRMSVENELACDRPPFCCAEASPVVPAPPWAPRRWRVCPRMYQDANAVLVNRRGNVMGLVRPK